MIPQPDTEHLLTVAEVARWLRVSTDFVRQHASGTRLPTVPSIRIGGVIRFRREDIEAFLAGLRHTA